MLPTINLAHRFQNASTESPDLLSKTLCTLGAHAYMVTFRLKGANVAMAAGHQHLTLAVYLCLLAVLVSACLCT